MSDLYTGFLYKRENAKGFTWYYKIKVGNKVVKNKSTKTSVKKEAKKILDRTLYELEHGTSAALSKDMVFNDYLDRWLENNVRLNCKYTTYENYKKVMHEHVENTIGIYKIKQIDTYLIQELLNNMYKNGYSRPTVDLTRNVLSGAFKCAIQTYNLISINPVKYTKIPKYENSKNKMKDKVITIEQFNKLIELSPMGTDLYLPLQISFHTGMRRGEVLALQWEDIDLDNNIIHVRHSLIKKEGIFELSSPKTESSIRDISIGNTLVKILKAHKLKQKENKLKYGKFYIDGDWVCTHEYGELLNLEQLSNKVFALSRKVDFKFTFHFLRHTHATMLIEAGANIKEVSRRLGHDNLATTMDIYSHVTEKMKNETVDIFEKIIK